MTPMTEAIDVHNHVVPEQFPRYAGKGTDVPWPSMAEAHACHTHLSCTEYCPKRLSPTAGIAGLKREAAAAALKGEL